MKQLILLMYLAAGSIIPSIACTEQSTTASNSIQLIGCTPGDSTIKAIMGIDANAEIDFMRWDLQLKPGGNSSGQFVLHLSYGINQPNTQSFMNGGEKRSFEGSYREDNSIIQFTSANRKFAMKKIDDNVYHLLTPQQELMTGNAGWSYSLSRAEPLAVTSVSPTFQQLLKNKDTTTQLEFMGRTPCRIIASQMNWKVSEACWKLKWVMVLNRDPQTGEPSGFRIRQANVPGLVSNGNWQINKTEAGNMLTLNFNDTSPSKQLHFLIGNENVLFILDENFHPLVGNSEFSFTLNRKSK